MAVIKSGDSTYELIVNSNGAAKVIPIGSDGNVITTNIKTFGTASNLASVLNSSVIVENIEGYASIGFNLTVPSGGVVTFYGSYDGITYNNITMVNKTSGIRIYSTTTGGEFYNNIECYKYIKFLVTTAGISAGSVIGALMFDSINIHSENNQTYSAVITNYVVANNPTDVFTITGSATRTITVNEVEISATKTASGVGDILLIKRSTLNTGGTSTILTNVPYDSLNEAATATVRYYTANPAALGTAVGTIKSTNYLYNVTTATPDKLEFNFGQDDNQHLVLRGVNESLCVNLNAVTLAGNSFTVYVEWNEY